MLSALEKYLLMSAGGVKKLKDSPLETLGGAASGVGKTALGAGKLAARKPGLAAMLLGAGAVGGYAAGKPSEEEEEIEMLRRLYGRG